MTKAKSKAATSRDVELNRWCIEMAMRWPVVRVAEPYGGGALGAVYQPTRGAHDADADVIGRAARIMAWVKEAH